MKYLQAKRMKQLLPLLLIFLTGCQKDTYTPAPPSMPPPVIPPHAFTLTIGNLTTYTFDSSQVILQVKQFSNPNYTPGGSLDFYDEDGNYYEIGTSSSGSASLYQYTLTAKDSIRNFQMKITIPGFADPSQLYFLDGSVHSGWYHGGKGGYVGSAYYKDSSGVYTASLMAGFSTMNDLTIGGNVDGMITNTVTKERIYINSLFYKQL